jgi:post-segregation antitoxin (ccd killing protein)
MSEIVTIRVKNSLTEKLRKYKINVSKVVKAALEDEIKKRKEAELLRAVNEMKVILQKIPEKEIVKDIRETRSQR